jgi:hypothetical protein
MEDLRSELVSLEAGIFEIEDLVGTAVGLASIGFPVDACSCAASCSTDGGSCFTACSTACMSSCGCS